MYEILLVLFSLIVFLQIFYSFPILSLQAPARAEYERKENPMDKVQAITLYILLSKDSKNLETISDYINQFEFVEENVRSILEQREKS